MAGDDVTVVWMDGIGDGTGFDFGKYSSIESSTNINIYLLINIRFVFYLLNFFHRFSMNRYFHLDHDQLLNLYFHVLVEMD
jgi:hypothetical protein